MIALFAAFFAGVLTVLAPCVFPLLPIILWSSLAQERFYRRPLIITLSLAVSIVVFTILLKFASVLLDVPPSFWRSVSAALIGVFGLSYLFPDLYTSFIERVPKFSPPSSRMAPGIWSDVLVGASLGPIFTSCSPTYALILAVVLPASFSLGLVYLGLYALGLAAVMLLVAIFGQALVRKMGWTLAPRGAFRRSLGVIFLLVAVLIATGLDKDLSAFLIESGFFDSSEWEIPLDGVWQK